MPRTPGFSRALPCYGPQFPPLSSRVKVPKGWGRWNLCTGFPFPVGKGRAPCPLRAAGRPGPGLGFLRFPSAATGPSRREELRVGESGQVQGPGSPFPRAETLFASVPPAPGRRGARPARAGTGAAGARGRPGTGGRRRQQPSCRPGLAPAAPAGGLPPPRPRPSPVLPGNPPPPSSACSLSRHGNQILEGWEQMRLLWPFHSHRHWAEGEPVPPGVVTWSPGAQPLRPLPGLASPRDGPSPRYSGTSLLGPRRPLPLP